MKPEAFSTRQRTGRTIEGFLDRAGGNHGNVKELPDDLATMPIDDLAQQREVRDEQLVPLFRRWPALSRIEMRELRRVYGERLRIAKYIGRIGRRTIP
jgi:hypothetical protein